MRRTAYDSNGNDEDWAQPAIFCIALMYLDPGTGSILIQAIVAAILSILYFTKQFWMNIFSRISRKILRRRDNGNGEPGST